MFLQITEGLWSRCTPHCQGLRRAHAICQTDGKVAEWGILCWSTLFVFCVSHLDIVWKSHLYNLLLAATWNTGLCSKTHRRSGIMDPGNYMYLWAPVSNWHHYPHPLAAISGSHEDEEETAVVSIFSCLFQWRNICCSSAKEERVLSASL